MFNAIRIFLFTGMCILFVMAGVFSAEEEVGLAIASLALAILGLMLSSVFHNESLHGLEEKRSFHDLKSSLDFLSELYKWLFSKKIMPYMFFYLIFIGLLNLVLVGYSVMSALLQSFLCFISAPLFLTLFLIILLQIEKFAYFVHQKTSKV